MISKFLLVFLAFLCVCIKDSDAQRGDSKEKDFATSIRKIFIFKGTKYCGWGQIAKHYNDLGRHRKADICCRTHDKHCRARIKGWRKKYGLINWSWKTSSHCDCEVRFKKCLLKARTKASRELYNIYFKKLNPRCIRFKIVRVKKCVKRKWFVCKKYKIIRKRKAYFVSLRRAVGK